MKLSNTMIMNETLLPNSKKAFTLAEVLITLSILGVVAALTIPSLVNRQSQLAAIVKMKKAISQFEQVADVYMAENDATDIKGMIDGGTSSNTTCAGLSGYFKQVSGANTCTFTTADGVQWKFDGTNKEVAIAYDSETSPHYGVVMYVPSTGTDAGKVNPQTAPTGIGNTLKSSATEQPTYYYANEMLKLNKTNDTATAFSGF